MELQAVPSAEPTTVEELDKTMAAMHANMCAITSVTGVCGCCLCGALNDIASTVCTTYGVQSIEDAYNKAVPDGVDARLEEARKIYDGAIERTKDSLPT